jgi:peptidoglycan hydrolase-like protein with peptidoglycan-binding domain
MLNKKIMAAVTSAVLLTGILPSSVVVQAATSAVQSSRIINLVKGSRGTDVKTLQSNLNYLGYTVGSADGIFGNNTLNGVLKYQRNKKLTANGKVDTRTYNQIIDDVNAKRAKVATPAKRNEVTEYSTPSGFNPIDKVGILGDHVTLVQNMMKTLGYTVIVDGEYDITTARTLNKFKVANKLIPDGKVDAKTFNLLGQAVKSQTGQDPTKVTIQSSTVGSATLLTAKEATPNLDVSNDEAPIQELSTHLIDRVGVTSEVVTEVQEMLNKLSYIVIVDGEYDLTTARTINRFKQAKGITPYDGKVDRRTFDALVRSVEAKERTATIASRGKVGGAIAYDWYKDVNTKLFPIMSIAKVTDVYTGKSFMIQRTYGYNHADVEALTYADAMIMKDAVGGTWNWVRRPVVVETNGYRIAASMTSMPHAGRDDMQADINVSNRSDGYGYGANLEKIQGNGQDGHFDIHFLNSRRHFDNAVDVNHQKSLRSAIGR